LSLKLKLCWIWNENRENGEDEEEEFGIDVDDIMKQGATEKDDYDQDNADNTDWEDKLSGYQKQIYIVLCMYFHVEILWFSC